MTRDARSDPSADKPGAPPGGPRGSGTLALPTGVDAREESFAAIVEDQRFVAKDGTFAVANARRAPRGKPVVLVGDLAGARIGEKAQFRGRFEKHAVHGERFRVSSFVPILPSSRDGLAKFLGGGLVSGIGPRLAERVVARFGDRTLDVITRESARLKEVPGLGGKKGLALAEAVRERRGEADSLAFLHGLGLGPALSRKLYARFGARTATQLREDPYLAAEEVPGIGFLTADRIGKEIGIAPDDPRRARGALLYVLARGADDGHTCLPREELVRGVASLGVPASLVPRTLEALAADHQIVLEGDDAFLPELHEAEEGLAQGLRARVGHRKPSSKVRAALEAHTAKGAGGVALADRQREAVERSTEVGVLVLTGGPGTGKTTTLRAIVAVHEALERRVLLAAPTGRAAKRMSEATGREAKTIHRVLEWNPGTADFVRGEDHPLDADVVIVDEASMLDVRLGAALERAIHRDATLVLVGDIDQLPPVGAGHVLREVIGSEVVPVVRLERVFRQAEESAIVRGAHAIASGQAPSSSPRGHKGPGELFVVEAHEPERVVEKLREVLRRIPPAYELDPVRDVQVLTPMRKGPLGTDALNAMLQEELVPTPSKRGRFRVGDKVMQTANDYEREVWNGDIGWVRRVVDGVTYVDFDVGETSYRDDELDGLVLAYAATVHKSQGSEFPAIVLVLHGSHHVMLARPLLYTAITRARRLVVIVGEPSAIARAARNVGSTRVQGRLARRLRGELDAEG
ncbi:MAG: ATP-dependent RecD-like DNA helicase [Sandaracinaceae bacterium]|nr:ATP-dependent RecD-like DNA helicase [Sandaracinaceae bacterium]